jgi:7,8-dihydropterin-6-yl-methyl-4-(beta-D-ribofuranosyl)aminobenzene 5'-phosphate synthase
MKIVVLVDNTVIQRDLLGEHGLAYWVETDAKAVLFDTGQGRALAANAATLRLDIDTVDAIVLSHGHYDHTGGLAWALQRAPPSVKVFAHPDALRPKYHRNAASIRAIGISAESLAALITHGLQNGVATADYTEVVPGVHCTGPIPRVHPEELPSADFCTDAAGTTPDSLADDQSLVLDTPAGIVVLLGCAHAGLINTLDRIRTLTGGRPIHAVIGGMHLGDVSEARLRWTINALRRFRLNLLVPLHCTGLHATCALMHAFPETCRAGGAGATFTFPSCQQPNPD